MSETPKPEQVDLPEATAATLHDVAISVWQNNIDAVRNDELPYGGQSLRLYPTDNRRDSILIFPVMGHKSMEDGTFRMLRQKGSRTTDLLDMMTTRDGERLVSSLGKSDLPSVMELIPAEEDAIPRMQKAISEASPVRPLGKLAKSLGRTASHKYNK